MMKSPRGVRPHIALFGRRNAGKSSVMNALTRQKVAIVSDVPGTTTDPVEKAMEFQPLGPVVFIDTAGLDDEGALGGQRAGRSLAVIDRTDLALIVVDQATWGEPEEDILRRLRAAHVPVLVVLNKADLHREPPPICAELDRRTVPWVRTATAPDAPAEGVADLREAIVGLVPEELVQAPRIVGDLVRPGDAVVLVVPIDQEAPKGRLILPQVQTIRDLLDEDAWCLVVKEAGLREALAALNRRPALVVTDSQAFEKVAAETPPEIPLTSFSILFARQKGDLEEFVRGAMAIDRLRPGDRVLVADACTHHPVGDDIGRVKIPAWLNRHVGGPLRIENTQGRDWPASLPDYQLVIHCGACMWTRREMLSRVLRCREGGVPITNFGMAIAWSLGVFHRALQPFPAARAIYEGSGT